MYLLFAVRKLSMCLEISFRKYFSLNRWTNAICTSRNTLWKPTVYSTMLQLANFHQKLVQFLCKIICPDFAWKACESFLSSLPSSLHWMSTLLGGFSYLGMDIFHRYQIHFSQSNASLKTKLPHKSHQWKEFCRIYVGKTKQNKSSENGYTLKTGSKHFSEHQVTIMFVYSSEIFALSSFTVLICILHLASCPPVSF